MTIDPSAIVKTGRIKGHKSWRGGDHGSRAGVVAWEENKCCVGDRLTAGRNLVREPRG